MTLRAVERLTATSVQSKWVVWSLGLWNVVLETFVQSKLVPWGPVQLSTVPATFVQSKCRTRRLAPATFVPSKLVLWSLRQYRRCGPPAMTGCAGRSLHDVPAVWK